MKRIIALIFCLIATLLLVHIQPECVEVAECGPDAEIECCALIYCLSQNEISERPSDLSSPVPSRKIYIPFKINMVKRIVRFTDRSLYCVFRE